MKSILMISILSVLAFSACQKDDDMVNTGNNIPVETTSLAKVIVPPTFTQKLLMEMYSTVSCATCPDAEVKYDNYAAANPDKVYGVTVHTNDAMANAQFGFLDGLMNVTTYSSSSFNRLPFNGVSALHKTTWNKTIIGSCLNKTASTGLMLTTTLTGSTASTTITAGFNKVLSGTYYLTVYAVEDNVTGSGSGYNQSNYYNNIATSPFFQLGNPIIGYKHSYVLRKVLTPAIGVVIPASSITAGGSFSKTYSFSTTGYNTSQIFLIAFVNKTGPTYLTQEIMNVQRVKLGMNKAWD